MIKPAIHIVGGGNGGYTQLFTNKGWVVSSDIKNVDAFLFTGGEDVSPEFYGQKMHPCTHSSLFRDVFEKKVFNYAVEHQIPMIGICRGGQFLNVMSGGEMYQHVTNHAGQWHDIKDVETELSFFASSTHHQMMRPGNGGVVVAVASNGGSKEYCHKIGDARNGIIKQTADEPDTEVVFYPNTNSLCFQPHPEFVDPRLDELKDYLFSLIHKYFNLKA